MLSAIDEVPTAFPTFCPKLGEFKQLCWAKKKEEPEEYPPLRLVDLGRSEPSELGRTAIAALKAMFKGKRL